jgi:hypothetical protein
MSDYTPWPKWLWKEEVKPEKWREPSLYDREDGLFWMLGDFYFLIFIPAVLLVFLICLFTGHVK